MAKLKQQDKCPSESLPSSLLHYTSMDTFMKIIKDSSNGFLHFHASHGRLMNDKAEGAFFFDKLFLTSEESKRKVEKPIKEFMQTSGEYYIISLSRTRAKSPSGLSAMWYEYADRGKGVMLRFDYKTLKERAASGAFVIGKCDYLTSSKVDEAVKKSRKLLKESPDETIIKDIFQKAYSIKSCGWYYEDEWRIIINSSSPMYKCGKYGLTPYVDVSIPIESLKEVFLGPTLDFELNKHILETYQRTFNLNFRISECKLKCR